MSPEEANEYQRLMKNRPHVVIIDAGATMAAIPKGDRNGKKSSVMNGFIETLGMTELFRDVKLQTSSTNVEDIYSALHSRPECDAVREELDARIRAYFSDMELPDEPNIYGLLLLVLKSKHLIARSIGIRSSCRRTNASARPLRTCRISRSCSVLIPSRRGRLSFASGSGHKAAWRARARVRWPGS